MAATINFTVPTTRVWVEAVTSGSGLITNSSNLQLEFAISGNTPTDGFVGHRLNSRESFGFSLDSGLSLFMRAPTSAFQDSVTVPITPDDPA